MKRWGLAKAIASNAMAYKLDFVLWAILHPLQIAVYYFLWVSVYKYGGLEYVAGYSLNNMITYYVLSIVVGALTWVGIEEEIEEDIVSGNMIQKMTKPMSVGEYFFFEHIGYKLLEVLLIVIPTLLSGYLLFGAQLTSFPNLLLFSFFSTTAMVMNFLLSLTVGALAFWMKKIHSLVKLKRTALFLLSGGLFPLELLPAGVRALFDLLPFKYLLYVPIKAYFGEVRAEHFLFSIGWVFLTYLCYKLVWRRAYKQFQGVGV